MDSCRALSAKDFGRQGFGNTPRIGLDRQPHARDHAGMKVLAFTGRHTKDDLTARVGWALVRLAQAGARYKRTTHVESLLSEPWYSATIASSSLRDGGVRVRHGVRLNPAHWMVIDIPIWDVDKAIDWYASHEGARYDWRGAVATIFWFLPDSKTRWFCNEAVAAPFGLIDAHRQTPAAFIATLMSLPGSQDVTAEFFAEPEVL